MCINWYVILSKNTRWTKDDVKVIYLKIWKFVFPVFFQLFQYPFLTVIFNFSGLSSRWSSRIIWIKWTPLHGLTNCRDRTSNTDRCAASCVHSWRHIRSLELLCCLDLRLLAQVFYLHTTNKKCLNYLWQHEQLYHLKPTRGTKSENRVSAKLNLELRTHYVNKYRTVR